MKALLADLRAGRVPSAEALGAFAAGLANGSVSDAQAGAFAMGVCRGPGLGQAGRVVLTEAMARSGDALSWDLDGPIVDKHSTGGVGDPVSLVLAPMLAAVGCFVPMISGRGLGHTGGTLDKLEAIPGLSVELDAERFCRVVQDCGCAIVAASDRIAPADRRLYAVRDATATVDQLDLITASILSKKLAAGLDALVLDVKCGTGAFMAHPDDARDLARALVETANGAGCRTSALITAMDQPLAPACGNAVEIAAVMAVLTGTAPDTRLRDVALALGATLLELAGIRADLAAALDDGRAADRFGAMVAAMGGPSDFVDRWDDVLPVAPVIVMVTAERAGTVCGIDGKALGQAVVALGGGRARPGDAVDPSVGLSEVVRLGTVLESGDPLARVHAADADAASRATRAVRDAIRVGEGADAMPLVLERVG